MQCDYSSCVELLLQSYAYSHEEYGHAAIVILIIIITRKAYRICVYITLYECICAYVEMYLQCWSVSFMSVFVRRVR